VTAGPFERNGVRPRMLDLGRVTRMEAASRMVAYLEREGVLDGMSWEALGVPDRETWVKAITEVYAEAAREISREAREELALYEEMALLLVCRRCGADEEEPCRDQRVSYIKPIKHPHQERMDDMEAQL
jgi:hypothetical protein